MLSYCKRHLERLEWYRLRFHLATAEWAGVVSLRCEVDPWQCPATTVCGNKPSKAAMIGLVSPASFALGAFLELAWPLLGRQLCRDLCATTPVLPPGSAPHREAERSPALARMRPAVRPRPAARRAIRLASDT